MTATPREATFTFYGRSKQSYTKDGYFGDVSGAPVHFDAGAGASANSPTDVSFPEDVVLTDMSIVTGAVDTKKAQLAIGGQPTGDVLRYAMHETTLTNRPRLNVLIRAGQRFNINQLA